MSNLVLIFCSLFSMLGQGAVPAAGDQLACLTQFDRDKLAKESKLDNRIKIYDEASSRCEKLISGLIQQEQFQATPDKLKLWGGLLDSAIQDIESAPGRKDKSKPLIRFEIHLRRSISAMQESKIKADAEQQDAFESWINQTELIRKKLVGFLFPGS
jgi:hypothetical protein